MIDAGVYDSIHVATTVQSLLVDIKLIVDHRLFARSDFYRQETIARLVGAQAIQTLESSGDLQEISFMGFSNLLRARDNLTSPAIEILAWKKEERGKDVVGILRVTFHGVDSGLDFKSVVNIFGSGWKEDVVAEYEARVAVAREPSNPPYPQATNFMGNKIVSYSGQGDGMSIRFLLRFSSDGTLWQIECSYPYAGDAQINEHSPRSSSPRL